MASWFPAVSREALPWHSPCFITGLNPGVGGSRESAEKALKEQTASVEKSHSTALGHVRFMTHECSLGRDLSSSMKDAQLNG